MEDKLATAIRAFDQLQDATVGAATLPDLNARYGLTATHSIISARAAIDSLRAKPSPQEN